MFQVIDIFKVPAKEDGGSSEVLEALPAGVWFVLNPQQARGQELPLPGQTITIRRPDTSVITAEIAEVQVRHEVVALRFVDLSKEDVPRLSEIEWRKGLNSDSER